jgi:hypothetical protein
MPGPFIPLVLGAQILMVAASDPPRIDAEATCRASEREITKLFGDQTMITFDACMKQESDALERLQKQWTTYSASAKEHCVQPKSYMPSYVEWVTCLDMDTVLREQRAKEVETTPPVQRTR